MTVGVNVDQNPIKGLITYLCGIFSGMLVTGIILITVSDVNTKPHNLGWLFARPPAH